METFQLFRSKEIFDIKANSNLAMLQLNKHQASLRSTINYLNIIYCQAKEN